MRPAGGQSRQPAGRGAGRRRAKPRTPAQGGRGRGRGGSGFRASEVTPLVIDGIMYLSTPYSRVVALEPTTGKEIWAFQLPAGNPSTRGVEYWPGDAQTPRADRLRFERRQVVLAEREDRQAQRRLRRQRHRQSEHARDHAGAARPQRAQLRRRSCTRTWSSPAARRRRIRRRGPRATCARGTCTPASWRGPSIPFRAPAKSTTTPGPATAGRTARASTCGASSPWTPSAASSTCRSARRRSISTAATAPATTCSAPVWWRRMRIPANICGTSRWSTTTSGTPI